MDALRKERDDLKELNDELDYLQSSTHPSPKGLADNEELRQARVQAYRCRVDMEAARDEAELYRKKAERLEKERDEARETVLGLMAQLNADLPIRPMAWCEEFENESERATRGDE
ncbi:MAG: hypothetical protein AAF581_11105 [Planctomycetota bacterium]